MKCLSKHPYSKKPSLPCENPDGTYEFAKVNTIALIWQLLSSILITKFWNMFEHHVLVLHEKQRAWYF